MEVTVGICAHNEEANIKKLLKALLSQKLCKVHISRIIVVSSGSEDGTDEIVAAVAKKSKRVLLIKEPIRRGKVSALNIILKASRTQIIVLISADVLPEENSIERLCLPLKIKWVGICGARPVPLNAKNTWLGFAVHVVWGLHHRVSLQHPKFGECIAFKKSFRRLPQSAVDEEEIASIVLNQGFHGVYVPEAVVYNRGPSTVRDFINQRRRIYAGHLILRKRTGHCPPTMSNLRIAFLILSNMDFKAPVKTLFAIALEGISRVLGYWDFLLGRKHIIWKEAKTTKRVS